MSYRTPWYIELLGEQAHSQRLTYHRNQLGLRDRNYPITKPQSSRRVLVLGDSFTFGLGVSNDSAVFPKLLEQWLNRTADNSRIRHIEVLNGGLAGSLTADWMSLLERVTPSFNPDVVLVVFSLRDGTRTTAMGSFFGPIRNQIVRRDDASRLYRHLYTYRLVRDYLDQRQVAHLYSTTLKASYFGTSKQTEEWRVAQDNLLRLLRFSKAHSAVMGLAIFPVLVNLDTHYPFRGISDTIYAFSVRNSILVHDLLPDFKGHTGPELWVSAYDQHPNERGHAIAAHALLPFVQQLLTLAENQGSALGTLR
jgi:lysophospholipase L1-like esterase